ncbi:MAG: hypothetical protein ND895_17345 [Pyrinomonadaceae bacterium]|nr:hypothetical protein [Pyrinomonadaceae bacterium]
MNNAENRAADFAEIPSLATSLLSGAIGFGAASLVVFATVAFGEGWMYRHLGILGAYLAWTFLFILLGGGALGQLVVRRWEMPKFYLLFAAAFFAYAVGWTASYFVLRGIVGEWVGSVLGSLLMATVLAAGFRVPRAVFNLSAILFVANSLGYFLGSAVNNSLESRAGMLSWGLLYGLFLGAGLGAVLHFAQTVGDRTEEQPSPSSAIHTSGHDDQP